MAVALPLLWAAAPPLRAQQPVRDTTTTRRPPADTLARPDTLTRRDTVTRPDTTARPDTLARRDTVKAPLPVLPEPITATPGTPLEWNRAEIFASGALTLTELLDRVPGITTFRTGLLASPQRAAYLGNTNRLRVFYDGIELVALEPDGGGGGALALESIPLWTLEQVRVENGADEVRVYLRSWRVARTTPYTRTDVLTGDAGTNLFRGFFGKRFGRGEVLQLGGQQSGTNNDERLGTGNELSLLARIGIARAGWSVDALGVRNSGTRDPQLRLTLPGGVQQLTAKRTLAYVRAAVGTPGEGPWVQLLGSLQHFSPSGPPSDGGTGSDDTTNRVRSLAEYVAAAGFDRGPARFRITDRVRVLGGQARSVVSARAAVEWPLAALSGRVELGGGDSATLAEVALRVNPLPALSLGASAARRQGGPLAEPTLAMRLEGGLSVGGRFIGGGVMRQPATITGALPVYDPSYVPAALPEATGIFITASGRVWRDVGANFFAVQWPDAGPYRPRRQARTELFLDTRWLGRFPSGNFGFLAAVAEEYRGPVFFPFAATDGEPGAQLANYSNTLVTRVELRILSAVLFFRQRYIIGPPNAELVPGYVQLRQYNTYGVRWEFWN